MRPGPGSGYDVEVNDPPLFLRTYLVVTLATMLSGCPRAVPLDDAGPFDAGGAMPDAAGDAGPFDAGVVAEDSGTTGTTPGPAPEVISAGTSGLILRGVVLTPSGPLDPGEVLVSGGIIECVAADCSGHALAGAATVIQTNGVISPGLVDAHNHLTYDFLGEWVPDPAAFFDNRYVWADDLGYEDFVLPFTGMHCTGDATTICTVATADADCGSGVRCTPGRSSSDHICPAAKWGELRSIVHGTTTVLGQSVNRSCLNRLARNADHHHGLGADHMRTTIASPRDITNAATAPLISAFVDSTNPVTRYAVHMAEGLRGDNVDLEFAAFAGRDTRPNRHMGVSLLAGEGGAISLATSANFANGETVTIGAKVYAFQTTLTDVDGNVLVGADRAASYDNLRGAINLDGTAGTDYAASTVAHPNVRAFETSSFFVVAAMLGASSGIAITTTSAAASWDSSTLVPYSGVGLLIHALGVTDAELTEVASTQSSIVWSPSSNLVLYGATVPIQRIMELGINVALGPDWTPSGADEMLSEMRVAEDHGRTSSIPELTARRIWEMATVDGADAVGLGSLIGELAVGQHADITVFGRRGDPYQVVLDSRAQDVRLVLIEGESYYGDMALQSATAVNGECEALDACGTPKFLCVANTPGSTAAAARATETMADVRSQLVGILDVYGRGSELNELVDCSL